jgi:hypothetical protein
MKRSIEVDLPDGYDLTAELRVIEIGHSDRVEKIEFITAIYQLSDPMGITHTSVISFTMTRDPTVDEIG